MRVDYDAVKMILRFAVWVSVRIAVISQLGRRSLRQASSRITPQASSRSIESNKYKMLFHWIRRHWLLMLLALDGCWLFLEFMPSLRKVIIKQFTNSLPFLYRLIYVPGWTALNWFAAFAILFAILATMRFLPDIIEGFKSGPRGPNLAYRKQSPSKAKPDDRINESTKAALNNLRIRTRGW